MQFQGWYSQNGFNWKKQAWRGKWTEIYFPSALNMTEKLPSPYFSGVQQGTETNTEIFML